MFLSNKVCLILIISVKKKKRFDETVITFFDFELGKLLTFYYYTFEHYLERLDNQRFVKLVALGEEPAILSLSQ